MSAARKERQDRSRDRHGQDGQPGRLIIIGGAEDRRGRRTILKEVCRAAIDDKAHGDGADAKDAKLVVVTAATHVPDEYLDEYVPAFKDLGVSRLEVLDVRSREDAYDQENVDKLRGAAVVFFTGGSQQRIVSQMGGTPVCYAMRDAFEAGATVAGTSAGAAVMPETMLASGTGDEAPDAGDVDMAPGLGLLRDAVIDSHFSQRGRIGRLLAAVAQNPRLLGLGIDEDTAMVVEPGRDFTVIGSGAVYVVDGTGITYSSLERRTRGVLTVHNVKLHVLGDGHGFEWHSSRPRLPPRDDE